MMLASRIVPPMALASMAVAVPSNRESSTYIEPGVLSEFSDAGGIKRKPIGEPANVRPDQVYP
jgi:hypothetical protein